MPTLSQFKVLSHLLSRQAKARASLQQGQIAAEPEAKPESRQVTSATATRHSSLQRPWGSGPTYYFNDQGIRAALARARGSTPDRDSQCSERHDDTMSRPSSEKLENTFNRDSASKDVEGGIVPRDQNIAQNSPEKSPDSVGIFSDATVPAGASVDAKSLKEVNESKDLTKPNSPGKTELTTDPELVRSKLSEKSNSDLHTVVQTEQTINQHPTPRRPCLKRGKSCFIRFSDTSPKNVTFERPFSVASVYGNQEERLLNKDKTWSVLCDSTTKVKFVDAREERKITEKQEVTELFSSTLKHSYSEREGIRPLRPDQRPSSSGPTLQKESYDRPSPNNARLRRHKSFYLDRRDPNLERHIAGLNLPKPNAFPVRRDSLVHRTFHSGRIQSAPLVVDHQHTDLRETDKKEATHFETYIIRNGRLLKRSSSAFKWRSAGMAIVAPMLLAGSRTATSIGDIGEQQVEDEKLHGSNLSSAHGEKTRDFVRVPTTSTCTVRSEDAVSPHPPEHEHHHLPPRTGNVTPSSDSVGTHPTTWRAETRRWSKEEQAIVSEPKTQDNGFHTNGILLQRPELPQPDDVEVSGEVQEELKRLGFRKPEKGKKKKSKSEKKNASTEGKATSGEPGGGEGGQQKIVINIREDPVLQKMSKKNRNVGKFTSEPEPRPFAVCFDIHGADLSHGEVKGQVMKVIENNPEIKLLGLQFQQRALVHDEKEMDNRWIITTNSIAGRNRLAGNHLNFNGEDVQLRRYDDVISTEYQQFVRMTNFINMMNSRNLGPSK